MKINEQGPQSRDEYQAALDALDVLRITRAEASLAVGEMSAQEWRTVEAVLKVLRARMGEVK